MNSATFERKLARNVPLGRLDPHQLLQLRQTPIEEPIYFICAVGGRSAWACEMMIAAGYPNVVNVEGGTNAWVAAGLPVRHGA